MIRRRLFRFGLPVLALAALASAGLSVARSNLPDAAPAATAAVQPALGVVAALGRVEPVGGTRAVAPEVTGIIVEMRVRPGARVAPGDVLFRLDDRAARRRVAERRADRDQAQAALAQTQAQVATVRADLAAATARLAAAEAALAEALRDRDVAARLSARNAAAGRDVERREAALARAQADRDAARAEAARAEAALARLDPADGADMIAARAAVAAAEERLRTAQSDLGPFTVTAREGGTVLSVALRAGETAGPGQAVLTLAAGDGAVMRVFVDEVDAARVDPGRPGSATPRGQPAVTLPLAFLSDEPEVRPNRELSGRADDRIDTRVVELLYRLPADATVRFGETFDVTLPSRTPEAQPPVARTGPDTVARAG